MDVFRHGRWFGNGGRRRRRRQSDWRRIVGRLLANILFGVLLVGCASMPKSLASLKKEPPLVVLKSSQDPNHRLVAYRSLAKSSSYAGQDRRQALELLIAGLKSEPNELARSACAVSLGRYDEPEAGSALLNAVTDKSEMVRIDVCSSLGRQGRPESAMVLGRLAQADSSLDVRVAATAALTKIDDPKARMQLAQSLRDKDVAVSTSARKGLKKHYDIDLGADYDAWVQYVRDHDAVPGAAAEAIADSAAPSTPAGNTEPPRTATAPPSAIAR